MDEILSNLSYKSEKLDLNFEIHIENQASKAHQKCHILTVHNVGKNRKTDPKKICYYRMYLTIFLNF